MPAAKWITKWCWQTGNNIMLFIFLSYWFIALEYRILYLHLLNVIETVTAEMNPIFYAKFSLKSVEQTAQRRKKSLFRNGV